jgi:hypothetical protein
MSIFVQHAGLRELLLSFHGGGFNAWPFVPIRYVFRARDLLHVSLALNVPPPRDRMAALAAEAATAYRFAFQRLANSLTTLSFRLMAIWQAARATVLPRGRALLERLFRQVEDALREADQL